MTILWPKSKNGHFSRLGGHFSRLKPFCDQNRELVTFSGHGLLLRACERNGRSAVLATVRWNRTKFWWRLDRRNNKNQNTTQPRTMHVTVFSSQGKQNAKIQLAFFSLFSQSYTEDDDDDDDDDDKDEDRGFSTKHNPRTHHLHGWGTVVLRWYPPTNQDEKLKMKKTNKTFGCHTRNTHKGGKNERQDISESQS